MRRHLTTLIIFVFATIICVDLHLEGASLHKLAAFGLIWVGFGIHMMLPLVDEAIAVAERGRDIAKAAYSQRGRDDA